MNRRILTIASIIAGTLVIILGLTALFSERTSEISVGRAIKLPSVFAVSARSTNDTIITSNGRSIVRYNYKTGDTQLLSPDSYNSGLDGVDAVLTTDNGKYVVFHQPLADFGSVLEAKLTSAGLDPDSSYWWVFDTEKQTFTPIVKSLSSSNAQILDETVSIIDTDPDTTTPKITTYNLANPANVLGQIPVALSEGFFRTKDGYILSRFDEDRGNDVLFTEDGVVSNVLVEDAEAQGYLSETNQVIASRATDEGSTLILYDLDDKEQTEVASNINVPLSWNGHTIAFTKIGSDKPQYFTYNTNTKKTTAVNISDEKFESTSFKPDILLGDQAATLRDGSSIYLAGNDLADAKAVSSYDESVTVGNNVVEISYFSDESAFLITLNAATADAERTAVYQKLRDDGLNPDIQDIRFTLFTAPNVAL